MATHTEISIAPPSAQVVGNAFVEQYYQILHQSPEMVHKFYQDSSVLSRPEPDGVMTSVTTMKGINDKICSLDYKNYKAEIKTADAQESFRDGVIVLVTGCLTGMDNLRRRFSQSFFLAPQDNGYFVLNDVFRYVEENDKMGANSIAINEIDDTPSAVLFKDPEPSGVLHTPVVDQEKLPVQELQDVARKNDNSLGNDGQLSNKKAAMDSEPETKENNVSSAKELASSAGGEDAPKKSYASIVSSQTKKGNAGPLKIYVPANTSKVATSRTEKHSVSSITKDSATAANSPDTTNANKKINAQDEGDGHSIYIKNLPVNVTVAQLELEFKKFGPIKQGGIQVKSNKQHEFCFGFIEFQDLNSMNKAVQTSPVTIGDRQAVVEIKRTTARVGSAYGRFPSGRRGTRYDSFRGRGNFTGNRGYGRNGFGVRGDFSGRGRPRGRSGDGNSQQGRGSEGRHGGPSQNAVSA